MSNEFNPNFRTAKADLCKEELNKITSNGMRGNLKEDFNDDSRRDIAWETEQLAKSYGIYLAFDRAKSGTEKDWRYMVRFSIPGGGPISVEQWQLLDDLARECTSGPREAASIRLTTRQNVQFHWIQKEDLPKIVKKVAEGGFFSLNGCGDNTRNVMACPLSRYSTAFDANAWAQRAGDYFSLPLDPFVQIFEIDSSYLREEGEEPKKRFAYGKQLLNRKFKIAFAGVTHDETTGEVLPDNCVEALTNDLSIAPIIENGEVHRFQIYIGGGQGERVGKPSLSTLGKALGIVDEQHLLQAMDAVVKVHQEWGDRQNRHWARVKYVVKGKGIEWYRDQVKEHLGQPLDTPDNSHDVGARYLHHGWNPQPSNGKLSYGLFLENGRISDESRYGQLQTMCRSLVEKYSPTLMISPNQDLLFCDLEPSAQEDFEADLREHGYGEHNGKSFSSLRLLSGACVGRDTCRLTYTDSEKFEPFLIDELEALGWGDLQESIGITGCERQCFRPSTKSIGLVGSGKDRYQLRLLGSEDGRHQGQALFNEDKTLVYLRSIQREDVSTVIDSLLRYYSDERKSEEDLGEFNRRIGIPGIIAHFKGDPKTSPLMEKTHKVKGYLSDE